MKNIDTIANATVNAAIDATKQYLGDYFENTCKQRLVGGAGSIFDGIASVEEMERELRAADWETASHPSVLAGCSAYKTTSITRGHYGLVAIAELPDDVVLTACDPKGTGTVSMTVSGTIGPETPETWLIVGDEGGHDVVYTFHPGKPVRPSLVTVDDVPDGAKLSKADALKLGFELAKIVG